MFLEPCDVWRQLVCGSAACTYVTATNLGPIVPCVHVGGDVAHFVLCTASWRAQGFSQGLFLKNKPQ